MNSLSRDRLSADLKAVIEDSEALLQATVSDARDQAGSIRERLQESLAAARAQLTRIEEAAIAQSKAAARETDRYVRENPWRSLGVAAAAGVLLGMLLSRR